MPWLLDHSIGRSRASPDDSTACSIAVRLSESDSHPTPSSVWLESGLWVRLGGHVYAYPSHPGTWRRQCMAATLIVPAGGLFVPAAAALYAAPGFRPDVSTSSLDMAPRIAVSWRRCTSRGRSDGSQSSTAFESCPEPTARFNSPRRMSLDKLRSLVGFFERHDNRYLGELRDQCAALAHSRIPGMKRLHLVLSEMDDDVPPRTAISRSSCERWSRQCRRSARSSGRHRCLSGHEGPLAATGSRSSGRSSSRPTGARGTPASRTSSGSRAGQPREHPRLRRAALHLQQADPASRRLSSEAADIRDATIRPRTVWFHGSQPDRWPCDATIRPDPWVPRLSAGSLVAACAGSFRVSPNSGFGLVVGPDRDSQIPARDLGV